MTLVDVNQRNLLPWSFNSTLDRPEAMMVKICTLHVFVTLLVGVGQRGVGTLFKVGERLGGKGRAGRDFALDWPQLGCARFSQIPRIQQRANAMR